MAKFMNNANSVQFPKGGTTKMFGKQHAGPQEPGCTSHETKGDGGKFAAGGKGHMFGKGNANKMEPGVTAKKNQ